MAFDRTTEGTGTVTGITPAADTGTGNEITGTGTLTSTGGTGIDTSVSATTTTFALDLNSLPLDSTVSSTGWSEGDQIAVIDSATTDDPTKKAFLPAEIGLACSDETTALTTGDGKAVVMIPRAMTITEIKFSLTGVDTAGTVDVQLRYHATTPSSGSDVLDSAESIAMGEYYATASGTDFTTGSSQICDVNSFITVDIDSGSSVSDATGLKVWLLGYWT